VLATSSFLWLGVSFCFFFLSCDIPSSNAATLSAFVRIRLRSIQVHPKPSLSLSLAVRTGASTYITGSCSICSFFFPFPRGSTPPQHPILVFSLRRASVLPYCPVSHLPQPAEHPSCST
jgi:hypothetical protein